MCITLNQWLNVRFSQEQYSKKTMHKSNDHIIKPLTLTPHEKSLPPELTVIALSKFHSRIAHPDARLHSILSLETLKKKTNVYDTQFHQNVASPNKKPPPALQQKGEKRRRKSQISGYDGDDVFDDDSFQKKPRVRASGDRVRKLDAAGSHGSGDTSSAVCASSGAGGTGYAERAATIPLEVLQPQLEAVFQVFWELELAPPALATPFFGLVTRANCDVLGLPRFFDKVLESCSLANISVSALESLLQRRGVCVCVCVCVYDCVSTDVALSGVMLPCSSTQSYVVLLCVCPVSVLIRIALQVSCIPKKCL
jgi:hypothetical protein